MTIQQVIFKFSPGDFVKTPFDEQGLVVISGINVTEMIEYYVLTQNKNTSRWYGEAMLEEWLGGPFTTFQENG